MTDIELVAEVFDGGKGGHPKMLEALAAVHRLRAEYWKAGCKDYDEIDRLIKERMNAIKR